MAVKKLGIDLGNSTIKIAGLREDGRKVLAFIPSAYNIKSGSLSSSKDGSVEVSVANEANIYLGEGMPLNAIDKTNRQHFKHQILYSVWKAFGEGSHVVKLGVGLPIKTYKVKNEEYVKKLEEILKIQGTVNGVQVTANIDSFSVYPEGYSSMYSLDQYISQLTPTLVVDIGYKTTDVVQIRWSEEKGMFIIEKYETIDLGLYDFLSQMSERLLAEGADMTPEELNKRLTSQNTIIRTTVGSGTRNLKSSLDLANDVYEQLISTLELKFGQLLQFDLLFTGGGSKMFLEGIGKERLQNVLEIPDEKKYYSNALGYLEQLIIEDEE